VRDTRDVVVVRGDRVRDRANVVPANEDEAFDGRSAVRVNEDEVFDAGDAVASNDDAVPPFATLARVTATLYTIHHSPWSERARWALTHHKVDFRERIHVPLTGELALRMRAKRWGKVSVPLLVDDDGTPVVGSLAIAEHVDAKGGGSKLFPEGARDRIRALYEAFEGALNAGRARVTGKMLVDDEALDAGMPSFLRGVPFGRAMGRVGVRFITRKYEVTGDALDERSRAGLLAAREALGGKPYVLDAFSFADILAASVVQTIEPVADAYLKLPPATRAMWTHDGLRREFADLVAWRDRVYRERR
jgi:glutathione S-transferase